MLCTHPLLKLLTELLPELYSTLVRELLLIHGVKLIPPCKAIQAEADSLLGKPF